MNRLQQFLFSVPFLLAPFVIGNALASEHCSNLDVSEAVLKHRLDSANQLIPNAEKLNDQALYFLFEGRLLAQNVTEGKPFSKKSYGSLLSQYNEALSLYRVHRKEYLEHCKKFHQPRNDPKVASPYVPIGRLGKLKPMKLKVQDKCQQLVELETQLLENEKRVMSMLENLVASRSKEGEGEFFNMWSNVKALADQNNSDAIKYSHIGLQKTAQISSGIHSEIAAATRDGILSYQKQVFAKYKRSNALQNAIQMRSGMHIRFARMILFRLSNMKPAQAPSLAMGPGHFSGDQLDAESRALKEEYAQVQDLYHQLQLAKSGK